VAAAPGLLAPGGFDGGFALVSNSGGGGQPGAFKLVQPGTSYVAGLALGTITGTASAQQRYFNASPPFDHGDGAVAGYVFVLVNKNGEAVAHYAADVPPWAYNGPTNIRPDFIDPASGVKYRRKDSRRDLREALRARRQPRPGFRAAFQRALDEELARALKKPAQKAKAESAAKGGAFLRACREAAKQKVIEADYEPITMEMKMRDMTLIPQPFGIVPDGYTVVLLDAMDERIGKLLDHQADGGADDIIAALYEGALYADNEALKRKGPPGVLQAALKYR
jgi:hypothetical protein